MLRTVTILGHPAGCVAFHLQLHLMSPLKPLNKVIIFTPTHKNLQCKRPSVPGLPLGQLLLSPMLAAQG